MKPTHRTIFVLAVAAIPLLFASCCGERGTIRREVIAPSVNAVTVQLDALIDAAVEDGEMDPIEGETWKGESELLRSLVEKPAPR